MKKYVVPSSLLPWFKKYSIPQLTSIHVTMLNLVLTIGFISTVVSAKVRITDTLLTVYKLTDDIFLQKFQKYKSAYQKIWIFYFFQCYPFIHYSYIFLALHNFNYDKYCATNKTHFKISQKLRTLHANNISQDHTKLKPNELEIFHFICTFQWHSTFF